MLYRAVVQAGVHFSTFLENYYQDQIGSVPEHLEEACLPVWCAHLEGLISSLAPEAQRELPASVSAATLASWLGLIQSIFEDGYHPDIELDDGYITV